MLLPTLVHTVESHADAIADELMSALRSNPRTTYLHRVSERELRERVSDLYAHLRRWIGDRPEEEIARAYRDLGARRRREGVPASELVYALTLAKGHLVEFIRRNDDIQSVIELLNEAELRDMIDHFFDRAVYHALRGYEVGAPESR